MTIYSPKNIQPDDLQDEPEKTPPPSNIGQHTLLSYLVANNDIWALAEPIIKSAYFDDEYKPVVDYLIEHSNEYKQVAPVPIVRMKTGVLLDRYDDANDARTTQWLINEVQTFCRHRAAEIEVRRAGSALQKNNSRATLEQICANFKDINEISLEKDLGVEVHRDARKMLARKHEDLIKPTGYKWLDRVTGGGFPCPGMVLIPGPSGIGKSNFLTNLLINQCMRGEFCVYVSLELNEDRIFERVSAIMSDVGIKRLYVERDRVAGEMERRMTIGDGIFRVKKMKMNGTTRSNINAYLKELYMKEGVKPTVLGLDYIDLMHPATNIRDLGDIHIKDKYTSEEFYSLLEEWQLLGITPSQKVKNQGDMDEFDHASVAGGTPKINTADYVIATARKEEEMWAFVQKGRYGGEGSKLPFMWNMNTLKISDGDEAVFYSKNPRWDPHWHDKEAQKEALSQQREINRESRNADNDRILSRIAKQNQSLYIGEEDEALF